MVLKINHFEAVDVFLTLFLSIRLQWWLAFRMRGVWGLPTGAFPSKSTVWIKKNVRVSLSMFFYFLLWVQLGPGRQQWLHWLCSSWGRETKVRILYHLPVVLQQIRCQTMAGQGIFRNALNRAFSHLGWEQRLQVLLEIAHVGSQGPPSPTAAFTEMNGKWMAILGVSLLLVCSPDIFQVSHLTRCSDGVTRDSLNLLQFWHWGTFFAE